MTFLTGKKTRWYLKRENLHVDAKIVLPCIALGLSPFVMQSTESLIAIYFNSSLLRYGGDMAVGTMTVLTSIMQFSNMPLQGLTQGAQPIVSYNFGAKDAQRVRDAYFCLLLSEFGEFHACVDGSTGINHLLCLEGEVVAEMWGFHTMNVAEVAVGNQRIADVAE